MKSGELKDIVTEAIRIKGESSVGDIVELIQELTGKEYAYTTIATVLKRLEEDNVLYSVKKKIESRAKRYYSIREEAPKEEAISFLRSFFNKFGKVGVRHLGEVMGSDFTDDEIEELRQKLKE